MPCLVWYSSAAVHDSRFLEQIKRKPHQIAVFDRAYVDYEVYERWTAEGVLFVTRLKDNAAYGQLEELDIPDSCHSGYLRDERIALRVKRKDGTQGSMELRRVAYCDAEKNRVLVFLTNIGADGMDAEQIGQIYRKRWQIELLFKQLKQNSPLKYFLGDNVNAIKTQIWCTLIANLLFTIVRKGIRKTIAFSNLVSFARQHLFSYNRLKDLIEKAELHWRAKHAKNKAQIPELFSG